MKAKLWYLYLVPAFAVMLALGLYPFLFNLNLSFHSWKGTGQSRFVGLKNFGQIFADINFLDAVKVTLIYIVSILSIEFILGIAISFLLSAKFYGRNFLRTFILITMVISPVVAGLIWRFLFNADWGFINQVLFLFGIPDQPWLTKTNLARFAVILADIWQWTPFVALICLAGMEALPSEIREASLVDGATWLQHQRLITLPLLRPIFLVALLFRFLDGLSNVDKIFVMTYGGPGNSTSVLSFYIFLMSFKFWQLGYAASLGILLLLTTIVLINLLFTRIRAEAAI